MSKALLLIGILAVLFVPVDGMAQDQSRQRTEWIFPDGSTALLFEDLDQALKDGCGGFYIFAGGSPAECRPTAPRTRIVIPEWADGT
jgi:hypothetical protein